MYFLKNFLYFIWRELIAKAAAIRYTTKSGEDYNIEG